MLGRGLGTVIDSFDNVLRFHEQLPHLNRHSKDVGKKTTILASNGNARSLHRLEKRLSKQKRRSGGFTKGVQELIFSVKQLSKDPDPTDVIKGTGCGKEVLQLAKDIGWPVRVWSDRSIPEEYHNFDGDPTSGMVILYNLLNEYDQIYLCGFNFLVGNRTDAHFYDSVTMKPCHNLTTESKIIKKMAKRTKKIKLLGKLC